MQPELNIAMSMYLGARLKQSIAEILKAQGFIEEFPVKQENPNRGTIRMFLEIYHGRESL